MSTKWKTGFRKLQEISEWKRLTGELYNISYPRYAKFYLENSTIFHFHEEESLTGELYDIHVHELEMFNWRALRHFMSTKWKNLTGEFYYSSCPRSGKV